MPEVGDRYAQDVFLRGGESDMEQGRYHFVGIAGVGMSALALAVRGQGAEVSGSDRYHDQGVAVGSLEKLRKQGIRMFPQDGSGVGQDVSSVVVSTAIESDSPDVVRANLLGVPVVHRAELLARLACGKRCLAVTGTCGKSTVTGMLGWILEQAGYDPTVVNGAPLLDWCDDNNLGSVRCGGSDIWIIEADESDKTLLRYTPEWAVITNACEDHFGIEETRRLFDEFRQCVKGWIVDASTDGRVFSGFEPVLSARGADFTYRGTDFHLPLPGLHNATNALLAILVCERLGLKMNVVAEALSRFRGICRRLEFVGSKGGVTVVDDYAHNPEKIRAALQALAPYHRRIIAVWRPHGYRPLSSMMDGLAKCFSEFCVAGGALMLLPVYDAGGTADRTVRSDVLASRIGHHGAEVVTEGVVEERAVALAKPGDAVLIMGARDPFLPELARRIVTKLNA